MCLPSAVAALMAAPDPLLLHQCAWGPLVTLALSEKYRAPGASLLQSLGFGSNQESGIKPCAPTPAPSWLQVSSDWHREKAGKGG